MRILAYATIATCFACVESFGSSHIRSTRPLSFLGHNNKEQSSSSSSSSLNAFLLSWEELDEKLSSLQPEDDVKQEPQLTFYRDTNGWCPFCERVWVCLRAKNIPYQERLISLFDKPEWYKEMVPTTQVPAVLIHNTDSDDDGNSKKNERRLIWESLDIMKALDEAFPDTPQLVFDTPEYIAAQKQNGALGSAGFGFIYAGRNATMTESEVKEKETTFLQALDDLEASLVASGGPFRLGTEFTGVDAEMIPTLERWRYQLPLSKGLNILNDRPALQKWFEAMEAFKPYSDRVGGDEYSWVATSAMFARYFGNEEDEDTKNLIAKSDAAANELVAGFKDYDGDCEAEFAIEAATKILSNYEAIIKDCTDPDPKSQKHLPRSKGLVVNADNVMRFITECLLSGDNAIEMAKNAPFPISLKDANQIDSEDMALAAVTVASRLCVPRDMSAPAAKILRAALMIVAIRILEGGKIKESPLWTLLSITPEMSI